jgi:hypothetical protein
MLDSEMDSDMGYTIPAGKAWAEGKLIRFTHTEPSDSAHSVMLALIPDTLLANVYVFANGVKGSGPLGYQSDVFDKPVSSPGGTPLRKLNVVAWKDTLQAQILKSSTEVLRAVSNNTVTIERKNVVINMPFIVWTDDKR